MSAEEALSRAEAQNPTLRAVASDLVAAQEAERSQRGATRPVVTAGLSTSRNERFSGTSQGPTRNLDYGGNVDVGVSYTAATGTRLEVGASSGVTWRTINLTAGTTTAVRLGPLYTTELSATATQPLLRGAGRDATRSALQQARARRTETELRRDVAASELARDVLVAYWELWYADRAVTVNEEALALAVRQHEEARQRMEVLGTLPRVDVLRFAREEASIASALVAAHQTREGRAIALGRLLGMAPDEARAIAPITDPALAPYEDDVETSIRRAMSESAELRAQAAAVAAAAENARSREDADQARLDLALNASAAGLWTDDMLRGLALPGGRPAFSIGASLELELPVGGGAAAGAAGQARAERDAAGARLLALQQEIASDVATQHADLDAKRARAELIRREASVAEELAEAERQRSALGNATATEVIVAQQDARSVTLDAARARVDVAIAVLRIRHRTGALLASLLEGGA